MTGTRSVRPGRRLGAHDHGHRACRMTAGQPLAPVVVDRYLPADIRAILEERFLRPVEEMATLEAISADGSLAATTGLHPALFADHGIVHARDVAAGVVVLAGTVHGRLVPARPVDRRRLLPRGRAFRPVLGSLSPASGRAETAKSAQPTRTRRPVGRSRAQP